MIVSVAFDILEILYRVLRNDGKSNDTKDSLKNEKKIKCTCLLRLLLSLKYSVAGTCVY